MRYICELCNKELKNAKGLGSHIAQKHKNITQKEYYDTYIKTSNEGICPICRKNTPFIKISVGYQTTCSRRCGTVYSKESRKNTNLERHGVVNGHSKEVVDNMRQHSQEIYGVDNPNQLEIVRQKISESNKKSSQQMLINYTNNIIRNYGSKEQFYKQQQEKIQQTMFEKTGYKFALQSTLSKKKQEETFEANLKLFEQQNNCIRIKSLFPDYGTGWYQASIVDLVYYNDVAFVKINDIDKIQQYHDNSNAGTSHLELDLVQYIQLIYSDSIIVRSRKIIYPYELDIYLPDIKLAIEYNGTYWHSIEASTTKEYHLNKSLLCREKGIRLIHIYEFENINIQKQLLYDLLVNHIDNYPKNDFNKNNLIAVIPKPTIIYHDNYTIYGAGKLY